MIRPAVYDSVRPVLISLGERRHPCLPFSLKRTQAEMPALP
jgi:hypothetical protein